MMGSESPGDAGVGVKELVKEPSTNDDVATKAGKDERLSA